MSEIFAITAAANSIRLDAQGRGENAFTVTNTSGRSLRGQARAKAEDPAQQSWLSIAGEAERDFPTEGTHQFAVQITVPPGSPKGNYSFHLEVVSVENPDEDFADSPAVTFEVPATEPKKKAFPWWIAAVAAAVLVIGGVGAWLIFSEATPEEDTMQPVSGGASPGLGPNARLWIADNQNRFWVREPVHREINWSVAGHANSSVGIAGDGETVFGIADGQTWMRPAVGLDHNWTPIGHAPGNVVGLAAVDGQLFVADAAGSVTARPVGPNEEQWKVVGSAPGAVALAADAGQLYMVDRKERLYMRDAALTPGGLAGNWVDFGHARMCIGLAAVRDHLYATTSTNQIWTREVDPKEIPWTLIGHANSSVGLGAAELVE